jgi:hypothetical protein
LETLFPAETPLGKNVLFGNPVSKGLLPSAGAVCDGGIMSSSGAVSEHYVASTITYELTIRSTMLLLGATNTSNWVSSRELQVGYLVDQLCRFQKSEWCPPAPEVRAQQISGAANPCVLREISAKGCGGFVRDKN